MKSRDPVIDEELKSLENAARRGFDGVVKVLLDSTKESISSGKLNESEERHVRALQQLFTLAVNSRSLFAGFYDDELDRIDHLENITTLISVSYNIGRRGLSSPVLNRIQAEMGRKRSEQTKKAREAKGANNSPIMLAKIKICLRCAREFIANNRPKTMRMHGLVVGITKCIEISCKRDGVPVPSETSITTYLNPNEHLDIAAFVI